MVEDLPDPELARALAAPLRRRIFDLVAASENPVTVAELTEALGCNHNAVRQHLARLRVAGLVDEQVEVRSARGRPRLLYTRAARSDPYARLATLLAKVVRTRGTARAVGRQHGRAAAAAVEQSDPVDALEVEAAHQGFAPRRVERGSTVDLVLDVCPFEQVAAEDPRTICALHRGLAEGLVERLGGARVESFVARDPYEAGCVVSIRRVE